MERISSILWRRAPFVLLRHRAVLLAVSCAAAVVALAAASAPLLRAGAESAALKNQLAELTPLTTGLEIRPRGPSVARSAAQIARVDGARRRAAGQLAASLPWLRAPVVTSLTSAQVPIPPDEGNPVALVPMARTGATAHVTKLAGSGDGAWLADSAARIVRVGPGGELTLVGYSPGSLAAGGTHVRVGAVYRALIRDLDNPYWGNFIHDIRSQDPNGPDPPSFLLLDREQLYRVAAAVGGGAVWNVYELPVDPREMTLSRAKQLDSRFDAVRREIDRGAPIATRLGCGSGASQCDVASSLTSALTAAEKNVATLTPILTLLATLAGLLALGTALATGIFGVRRRADEARLLFARGESTWAFAARTGLEALLPTLVGAGAGLAVALALVRALTPAGTIDGGVAGSAAVAVAVGIVATLVALGLGAAIAFAPHDRHPLIVRLRLNAVPWEVPALAAAAALFVVVASGGGLAGSEETGRHPRLIAILLPLLAAAALTGLATRAARPLLRRLSPHAHGLFLAVRRLAAARGVLALLTVTLAVSFAATTIAQTLSASLDASTGEKAYVSTGADVSGLIDASQSLPPGFPYPLAKVEETLTGVQLDASDGPAVEILASDPAALANVLHWEWPGDPRPALRALARAPVVPLPVVATHDARHTRAIWVGGRRVPVRVVASVHAFPGQTPGQPLLVAPQAALDAALRRAGAPDLSAGALAFVWARGPVDAVKAALERSTLAPSFLRSADELRQNRDLQTVARTYGFLRAVAAGAALLALVALLVYLYARERSQLLAGAFLRRMGLTRRAEAASLAVEAAVLVAASGVIGAFCALVVAGPLLSHLDPFAQLPPSPALVVPWAAIAVVIAIASVIGAVAGAGATLLVARRDVAEALRIA